MCPYIGIKGIQGMTQKRGPTATAASPLAILTRGLDMFKFHDEGRTLTYFGVDFDFSPMQRDNLLY